MHTIKLTFKCLKGSPPRFFKDYFKVFRTIHNTRGSGKKLLLPKIRTETARKSSKASKDFCRKGNSLLGSFHVLNYPCLRQPEINVLGQK